MKKISVLIILFQVIPGLPALADYNYHTHGYYHGNSSSSTSSRRPTVIVRQPASNRSSSEGGASPGASGGSGGGGYGGGYGRINENYDGIRGQFRPLSSAGATDHTVYRRNPVTKEINTYRTYTEHPYHPDGVAPSIQVDMTGRSHGGVNTPHTMTWPGRVVVPAKPSEMTRRRPW